MSEELVIKLTQLSFVGYLGAFLEVEWWRL